MEAQKKNIPNHDLSKNPRISENTQENIKYVQNLIKELL